MLHKYIFLLIMLFSLQLFAQTPCEINPEKSKIEWHGTKVTGEHNGLIMLKMGHLLIENGNLIGGTFTVDMKSITNLDLEDQTWNKKLVKHLKSDDFFAVEKHPHATLVITGIERVKSETSKENYRIEGDLTIKGITHPVEFPAYFMKNEEAYLATAKINVNRAKYDVRYGSGSFFENLGDKLIHDEFDLSVNLVAEKN